MLTLILLENWKASLCPFEHRTRFDYNINHDDKEHNDLEIHIDENKDGKFDISSFEEDRTNYHANPRADVDGWKKELKFSEPLKVFDIH